MRFEARRKLFHLAAGTAALVLAYHGVYPTALALAALAVGLVLSFVARERSLPVIDPLLDWFERDHHQDWFPAKGALFSLAGITFAVILFPRPAALASIAALTFGDGLSTYVGKTYGRVTNPLNPEKDLEGFTAGFIASALVAALFVRPLTAVVAAFVAMIVESFAVPWYLDDNLTVPLSAGTTVVLVQTYLLPLL